MRFEKGVEIINKFFDLNIDPRGDLSMYERAIKILFSKEPLVITEEELIKKCEQLKYKELESDISIIKQNIANELDCNRKG